MNSVRVCKRCGVSLLALVFLSAWAAEPAPAPRVRLTPTGHVMLSKPAGRVDQIVPLPGGRFAIRDTNYQEEDTQSLEVYDAAGRRAGRFGNFGRGPGEYYRLKDLALASDRTLWAADVVARLTRFDLAGKVQSTRLVLKPGYHIGALALDEPRGVYYLTGCLPERVYLDLGCILVHQYSLKDGKYLKSFLKTDPEALSKHLLTLEDYLLDLDSEGRIFAVDAPLFKVFRIDPDSGDVRSFPLASKIARPSPALDPAASIERSQQAYQRAYLIDRILVTGSSVVVSIRKPGATGFLLHVLSTEGRQLAADLPSPGRLVGKSRSGGLYFATRKGREFEIAEYRLDRPTREARR